MHARDVRRLTISEYVALDRGSDERWDYANGEAWATRGGSPEHAIVVRNTVVELATALKGRPCRVLPDGHKVATPRTGAHHYPDASVVCGPPAFDGGDERAIVNPTVLVEILSPTTADYDCGGKLAHYRTLETLEDYVLVAWESRMVEHHRRVGTDQWLVTLVRHGAVQLESIAAELALDALWLDLDWIRAR